VKIFAYDIGGANTKRLVLDGETGEVTSGILYFPLWERMGEFPSFLEALHQKGGEIVGVTLTAELCDRFSSKRAGVESIVSLCRSVFGDPFFLGSRGLVRYPEIRDPMELAAANWRGSLFYLEKEFEEGILVDMGSTTTDLLPFRRGESFCRKTDLERLMAGQLLYTGRLRTPLSAIAPRVPFRSTPVPVASEHFAITADLYTVLEEIEGYPTDPPDRRGTRREDALRRVARLLCSDLEEVEEEEVVGICRYLKQEQARQVSEALEKVRGGSFRDAVVYAGGIGKDLVLEAAALRGIEAVDLSLHTPAYGNLPCLGLAWMVKDRVSR
jgi:hypothetical protein